MPKPYLLLALAGLLAFLALTQSSRDAIAAPSFRWPWAGTDGWRYTQGFHLDYALDFQPQIAPNCGTPVDTTHTIRPVAPGHVTAIRYRGPPEPALPVSLTIDHGDGWTSYYTHLANVPASVAVIGAEVGYDTDLGNPSCYSGCNPGVGPPCATGRHIHFQILRNGSGSGILEVTICGWTVGSDGGLTRNGTTYYPGFSAASPIANTNCSGSPETPVVTSTTTSTPTSTATPTSTPTATATPTPTATPTATATPTRRSPNVGDAGCDGVVDARDASIILQFSARLIHEVPCFGGADTNQDGSIGPVDAVLILQYVAGFIDELS